jgi:hypothetical protein
VTPVDVVTDAARVKTLAFCSSSSTSTASEAVSFT